MFDYSETCGSLFFFLNRRWIYIFNPEKMESNGLSSDPKEDPKEVSRPETPAAGNTIICLDVAMINVKTKLELNALFAFDCTETGGYDCEAQQQSVLQSDDSLSLASPQSRFRICSTDTKHANWTKYSQCNETHVG